MGRKLTPPPESRFIGGGALVVGLFSAPFLAWYLIFRSWWALIFLTPLLFYVLHKLYGIFLLVGAWCRWRGSQIRGILVLSDSPHWKEYIQREWLSRLGHQVVVLNWSNSKTWRRTLPVRLFRYFCVGEDNFNFNPAVLVFRGLKHPYVYRYYYAFRDAKHGRPEALRKLEAHMWATFGKPGPRRTAPRTPRV